MTMVYYLHREPRRFTGGTIASFDLGGDQSIEIEPTHDSLLVSRRQPANEVETISCPGGAFGDGPVRREHLFVRLTPGLFEHRALYFAFLDRR